MILGIRPEHFQVDREGKTGMRLRVDYVEVLGADTLVYGHFGEEKRIITLRLPDVQHLEKHTVLSISVPPEKLHLFDPDSGKPI